MTAVATLTGALSHRLTVRRLQARMVKVGPQPGVRRGMTAFRKERSQGLSGMQGGAADKAAIELVEVQPCQMPMQTRSDTTA
jgi:hypothetical protein